MNQKHLFKVLVVSNWLLQFLLFVLPISSWYADPMIEKLMALDGYGAILNWGNPVLYQLPLWGFFIASVGMLFFKNWARYMYLALWAYGWFATMLFGFRVSVPAQGFIGMAIGTIDGALLYLVFLSSLNVEFRKRSNPS